MHFSLSVTFWFQLENVTRESKESTREQVNALAAQLTTVRERCNAITTEYEVLKSQHKVNNIYCAVTSELWTENLEQ